MDAFKAYSAHVNPSLSEFLALTGRDLRFVRGKGTTLEDDRGNCHDDWVAGFGTFNLGHNPDILKKAAIDHLQSDAPNLFVENLNPFAGELAHKLVNAAGDSFDTCFLSNSGSEAVEAALKTALLATDRPNIIYTEGAYHGTTLGALACMAKGVYRDDFEGVLANFTSVPFADAVALERALEAGNIAALILEPIQMEGGVRIASNSYLRDALDLCHRHGAYLILDEVQTGMGRTGALFAFQHTDIQPDFLVLAKSLGGGVVPIGATVMAEGIWKRAYRGYLRSEIHNSTFGGNALACHIASKVLDIIGDPAFLESVVRQAEYLFGRLQSALDGHPLIDRISWRGLLGGIALVQTDHPSLQWENMGLPELAGFPSTGPLIVERLGRRGILAQVCAHDWSVLRVEPPLIVDRPTCDRFCEGVEEAIGWLDEFE